jgi:hypothetical protein
MRDFCEFAVRRKIITDYILSSAYVIAFIAVYAIGLCGLQNGRIYSYNCNTLPCLVLYIFFIFSVSWHAI